MQSTKVLYFRTAFRGVAQPGRAPRSGRGGRRFKSSHPDELQNPIVLSWLGYFFAIAGRHRFLATISPHFAGINRHLLST